MFFGGCDAAALLYPTLIARRVSTHADCVTPILLDIDLCTACTSSLHAVDKKLTCIDRNAETPSVLTTASQLSISVSR